MLLKINTVTLWLSINISDQLIGNILSPISKLLTAHQLPLSDVSLTIDSILMVKILNEVKELYCNIHAKFRDYYKHWIGYTYASVSM